MALPAWVVLCSLLVPQWIVVAVIASMGRHNGFLFYGGGDETWYYTTAWVLGHGHMPQGYIGYGYSFLLAPLARIGGPDILHGLPLVIAFNQVVLIPAALLCIYGITKAIGGRGFAYLASLLWTVMPLISLVYFYARYHDKLINIGLVNALGLTTMGDFPSMIFVLIAGYFSLKAVLERSAPDALLAGAATGLAIGVKPSNAVFLPAPILALIIARHGRGLQFLALGMIPALASLALWKYRGFEQVPLFSNSSSALASGRLPDLPVGGIDIHRYISFDWSHFTGNTNQIKEYAWSRRLLGWIPIAGAIALLRRSTATAALITAWFAVPFFLKTASPGVSVLQGNFLRYILPAYPGFFLLLVSTPLLVPQFGRTLASRGTRVTLGAQPRAPRDRKAVFVIAALLSFLPLIAFALLPPLTKPTAVQFPGLDQYTPTNQFTLTSTRHGRTVVLSWPKTATAGARPFYDVIRSTTDGVSCQLRRHAAASCTYTFPSPIYTPPVIGTTTRTTFVDHPPPGVSVYRVILKAAPTPAKRFGDYMLVSRPVTVTVP
jgi:Dolichyl-phosphate-mannose-protein mannosyltransferase